ncbi:hypothetical protein [Clostridium sp.]|jgi:uncharacterized membrane protein YgaE (UPF0421/DUF939 family)|uniref:hypothetical protein n=2 Tax=Clostridium sp. TaxID=1506 RepID=UPI002FDE88A1
MFMDKSEKLKLMLHEELQWIQYRQKMLNVIEKKLIKMKEFVVQAQQNNISKKEIQELNYSINNLAQQVRALDEESRITKYEKIL